MRQLHCNHAWHSGFYTLATRCHIAVTLKYTEASSLKVLRHSLIIQNRKNTIVFIRQRFPQDQGNIKTKPAEGKKKRCYSFMLVLSQRKLRCAFSRTDFNEVIKIIKGFSLCHPTPNLLIFLAV